MPFRLFFRDKIIHRTLMYDARTFLIFGRNFTNPGEKQVFLNDTLFDLLRQGYDVVQISSIMEAKINLMLIKLNELNRILEAIHAQESKKASREKAKAVVAELRAMKLKEAAKKVEDGIEETLTYCDFPSEHWTRIRTNNVIERLNREIRRRTRVVGTFPDGNSALMLVCARLRHVAGTQWGCKKYMNMKHLEAALDDASIAG